MKSPTIDLFANNDFVNMALIEQIKTGYNLHKVNT